MQVILYIGGLGWATIAAIVIAALMLVGLITFTTVLCLCCKYYKKCRTDVNSTRQDPEVVTMLPTASATTHHQPHTPHASNRDTGYQPYPAIPPTATIANY